MKLINSGLLQLAELVDVSSSEAVLEEVKFNFIQSYPITEFRKIRTIYKDFISINKGEYKGFSKDNTPFFDLSLSISTFLAFARLSAAYNSEYKKMALAKYHLALIASLFHSSGYLQKDCDDQGVVNKHARPSVKVSLDFAKKYLKKKKYASADIEKVCLYINATELSVDWAELNLKAKTDIIFAQLVSTAVIMSNMSDRTYLEGLVFTFDEVRAAKIIKKSSVVDMLHKSIEYYRKKIITRLKDELGGHYKLYKKYFRKVYRINSDLYMDAIDKQIAYLENILETAPGNYVKKLKRKKPRPRT